jgi:TP901 family phage tail tape measure protein
VAGDTEKRITAKMVLDSTGFNDSLKGVNSSLKNAQSELKLASSGIQAFGKDSEKLKSVQEALSKQVELHAKKVDIYKDSIEKTTSKLNENIKERDKLKQSLDNANTAYEKAIKEYGKESDEAKKAKESVDKLTEEYKKKEKAVESNAKQIQNYTTNLNKANAELNKVQGELNKVTNELKEQDNKWISASKGLKEHSENLKNVGEKASNAGDKILGMTAPLVAVGVASAKVGMDFEAQMSRVKAISGATGDEFKKLEDSALDLGASTAFSAKQVAEAQEMMASAGFKTNEILSATPGVLDLAASSGENLATASTIAAGAIRGFGLDASQSAHVADVLAKAAADTNAGVASMGESFKYIAPLARGVGWDIESVAAAVGAMADANIDGSTSGTTLRGVISRLANPSKESATAMAELGFNAFDSNGKMKSLSTIVDELSKSMANLTDEQKQEKISTILGQEAMSGMMVLMQKGKPSLDSLAEGFKNSDGAAKQMATTMQDNAKASVEQMMGSLETAGIKLEKSLAPSIKSVADTVGNLADKFAQLSPETQESIIKAVGFSVALGGVLKVGGSVVGSIGTITGGMSKLAGAMGTASVASAGVGTATTVASGGISAMGLAAKAGALALNPWVLGISAAGLGLYALNNHLKKEAIPSIDLFSNKVQQDNNKVGNSFNDMSNKVTASAKNSTDSVIKISEATKKAVGAYIKLDDDAKKALTDLYVNSTKITTDTATSLVTKYNEMGTQIKNGMDAKYNDMQNTMKTFFQNSSVLTETEEAKALANLQKNNNDKKVEIDNYTKQIQDILKKASDEKRALTLDEQQKINSIQEQMKVTAVNTLSNQEVESKVILERLKDYGTRITAEQASEIIKNANKQRDGAVKAANDQYDKTVAEIIRMRDESHTITADQADKLIKEAGRQKDESIKKAGELRDGVVNKVTSMNSDLEKSVNTSTGNILTGWDKLKSWWEGWTPSVKNFFAKIQVEPSEGKINGTWTGSNHYMGGLTYMHEKGYELYNLPRGSRVYNHEASEELVKRTAEDVATKVAEGMLNKFGRGNNDVNVTQHIYTQTPSPSELARQTKNSLRELALNW